MAENKTDIRVAFELPRIQFLGDIFVREDGKIRSFGISVYIGLMPGKTLWEFDKESDETFFSQEQIIEISRIITERAATNKYGFSDISEYIKEHSK